MKHAFLAAAAALTLALGGSALAQDARSVRVVAGTDLLLPANGSEGAVQTAASLPNGAANGTVAYAQAQSIARYLAEREAEGQTRLAGGQRGTSPFRG